MSARLVFVTPYGYPALAAHGAADAFDYVGGAEIQQARLARALVARGREVGMVSADFGQPRRTTIDGITVESAYRPFAGLPGLRFVHPRWTGLWAALDRSDADIVYQRTAGAITGQCALWARLRGRRFVFACAHDFDVLPRSPALPGARDRLLYRYGLHHANRVLAQSAFQRDGLARHHGLTATIVRNLIELPPGPRDDAAADAVVWVGTVKPAKRPEWILDAAALLPHVRFVVAGGPPPAPMSDKPFRAFAASAAALANVEVLGFVPPAGVPAVLARARVFAHSSEAEGFPNTLLEAWAHGVPSVSAVDPDGAVAGGGVGLAATDVTTFVEGLEKLWNDGTTRRTMGARARAYVAERHAPGVVAGDLESAVGWTGEGRD